MRQAVVMGGVMGAVMLWMVHRQIVAGADVGLGAALGFVAAHGVIVLAAAALALFVPGMRRGLRAHRPRLSHIGGMALGAVCVAAVAHLGLHGIDVFGRGF